MYWSPVGQVPDIIWPLTTRKWSGPANQGNTIRVIVKDQVKDRIGFVSQPSGLFYIEGPFEAQRGELVTALRALGVHLTGPDTETLASIPFDPEWRLWPGSANRVMIYGWALPQSQNDVGPAGTVHDPNAEWTDDHHEDFAAPVLDERGRHLDPDTHEVAPPHERGIFYWEDRSLDVACERERALGENLLRRAGQILPAESPSAFVQGNGRPFKLRSWTPGEIGVPVPPRVDDDDLDGGGDREPYVHDDDPPASADPFAPGYRAALDAALAEACMAFATEDWEKLSLTTSEPYPKASVSVRIFFAQTQNGEEVVACLIRAGAVPRADPELPTGWRKPLPEETTMDDVLAIVKLRPDDDDAGQKLLELAQTALAWEPAASPALVQIELEPNEDTTATNVRRMKRSAQRRGYQIHQHQSCVGEAAVATWQRERPIMIDRGPTGDAFNDWLIRELDATARAWLTPSEWEARDNHLDEWIGSLDELLERATAAEEEEDDGTEDDDALVSFSTSDLLASLAEDDDVHEWAWLGPERMLTLLRRWSAREWIAGGDHLQAALIAARGTVHPHRPEVSDLAEYLMQLAFLRRDMDAVLHWGGEWIANTSYASLASPIKGYTVLLRAQGETDLAREIEKRSREIIPDRMATFS